MSQPRSTNPSMRRVRRRLVALVLGLPLAVAAMAAAPASGLASECSNEAVREQQGSTYLPECRAYEMVSPVGSAPESSGARWPALDGERYLYTSIYPYPGQKNDGMYLLSTRGEAGWSTETLTPPQGGVNSTDLLACALSVFGSAELTGDLLLDGVQQAANRYCEGDVPALVPGEPRGVANLFLQEEIGGSYELLDKPLPGVAAQNTELADATPELSHILFYDGAELLPEAPEVDNLYEWAGGALHLVTVLPSKAIVHGVLADGRFKAPESSAESSWTNNEEAFSAHAMATNGETVFFYAQGKLYVRENATKEPAVQGECSATEPGTACTVEVDSAAAGASGESGEGVFARANATGTRVFFFDERKLTTDSGAVRRHPDLYEYDLETRALTDLTPAPPESRANVLGILGGSEGGEYVYFAATGVLTGEEANEYGAKAVAGQPNLYVRHAGATTFIATLSPGDEATWGTAGANKYINEGDARARVSSNGEYVAFDSSAPLTGAASCGAGCQEIFLYSAKARSLSCISCAAAGVAPVAGATLQGSNAMLKTRGMKVSSQQVMNDGVVFFESAQPLLSRATDGEVNLYEYLNGETSLISSGVGRGPSLYQGASANGSNVFFITGQGLVASDTDEAPSVYDARIGGGWLSTSARPAGEAGPCEEAIACRPPGGEEPPVEAFGASSAFDGPSDLAPSETSLPEPAPSTHKGSGKETHHGSAKATRRRKLKRALARCDRRPKRKRRHCRRHARKRFGAVRRHRHGSHRAHNSPKHSERRGHGHRKRSGR